MGDLESKLKMDDSSAAASTKEMEKGKSQGKESDKNPTSGKSNETNASQPAGNARTNDSVQSKHLEKGASKGAINASTADATSIATSLAEHHDQTSDESNIISTRLSQLSEDVKTLRNAVRGLCRLTAQEMKLNEQVLAKVEERDGRGQKNGTCPETGRKQLHKAKQSATSTTALAGSSDDEETQTHAFQAPAAEQSPTTPQVAFKHDGEPSALKKKSFISKLFTLKSKSGTTSSSETTAA